MAVGLLAIAASACVANRSGEPAALPEAAAELLRARLHTTAAATAGAHHAGGTVDLADGERLSYDRSIVMGSDLGHDRGAAFTGFLADVQERGGTYRVLQRRADGSPNKVLMVCDDLRVVVAVLQW